MTQVVRVARDGGRIIVRTNDVYVRVAVDSLTTDSASDLASLTAGGGWRMPSKAETEKFSGAAEVATAASVSLDVTELATTERQRVYQVPAMVRAEAERGLRWLQSQDRGSAFIPLAEKLASAKSVDIGTVRQIQELLSAQKIDREEDGFKFSAESTTYPSVSRVTWSLLGGDYAERWTSRVAGKHVSVVVASAFVYDPTVTYLAGGDDPDSTEVYDLYMVRDEETLKRENGDWTPVEGPTNEQLIELDEESATTLANWIDDTTSHAPGDFLELRNINPIATNLFDLAKNEIDYTLLDRVMVAGGAWDDGRPSQDRADSAQRQARDSGGQFNPGSPDSQGDELTAFSKGRLPSSMPLLTDVIGRIGEYLAESEGQQPSPVADAPEDDAVVAAPAPQTVTVEEATPDTSDVRPLYVAIVDSADPEAVLDLIAIIPAKAGTNQGPTAWKRSKGTWEFAPDVLEQLQSVTPPPVVELTDDETVNAVIQQIDSYDQQGTPGEKPPVEAEPVAASVGMWGPHGEQVPLYAAALPGVADTPGEVGNADRLREYWTTGEGGAKIGWGTGGDWYRCVGHLSKYLGNRAKGYCTLRHKDATGAWPGKAPGESALQASGVTRLEHAKFEQSLITMGQLASQALIACGDMPPIDVNHVDAHGGSFVIPVLIPEGVESGDGRSFEQGALSHRDLPLPLLWQIQTGDGHDGAVVVGRIDSIDRLEEGGLGRAVGVFDAGAHGQEAERLVRGGFLRGVSADLDQFVANVSEADDADEAADGSDAEAPADQIKNDKISVSQARLMAATLVPKPAFQECQIMMSDEQNIDPEAAPLPLEDGIYQEEPGDGEEAEVILSALAASAAPVKPPRGWFDNPALDGPTPLTIDDQGRVFGHIAAWKTTHIGLPTATPPPKSASNYAYYRTGTLRTEEGGDVAVGQLTLAGGHAPLRADASSAVKHYDDTASAVADVAAGEDQHGIWVAGALRPGVTPEQVRVLRASAPSGDWRPINGKLELVAVCQVNVPGFPVARAFVASGAVTALVAAGARYMAELRDHPVTSLAARVDELEAERIAEKRAAVLARLEPARRARQEALVASAAAARARIAPLKENRESLVASAEAARARMGRTTEASTETEVGDSPF